MQQLSLIYQVSAATYVRKNVFRQKQLSLPRHLMFYVTVVCLAICGFCSLVLSVDRRKTFLDVKMTIFKIVHFIGEKVL